MIQFVEISVIRECHCIFGSRFCSLSTSFLIVGARFRAGLLPTTESDVSDPGKCLNTLLKRDNKLLPGDLVFNMSPFLSCVAFIFCFYNSFLIIIIIIYIMAKMAVFNVAGYLK